MRICRSVRNGKFGKRAPDTPSADCLGVLSGLAAAASGHLLRMDISNLDNFPGIQLQENGEHNWPTTPAIEGTAYVDGNEVSVPDLLLLPPVGKAYRFIFEPAPEGIAAGIPDGALIRHDTQTRIRKTAINVNEHGIVTVG